MEDKMTAAAIKAALASQNKVAANDKLITAKKVIAAQKIVQKQVAADHLFSTELQRKERAEEELREATRIE